MAENDIKPESAANVADAAPPAPPNAAGAKAVTVPEGGEAPTAEKQSQREAGPTDFFRVFAYATKWDFLAYAVGGLASVAAGTTMPLMNVVFGQFVGNFTDVASATPESFNNTINQLGLYLLILFLARFALNTLNKFAFRMIGIRLSSAIRQHYLRSLFGQSIHVLDSLPPGAAASTITATSNVLQLGISEKLGTVFEWSSTIVTALIIAFVTSWRLTLVTFSIIAFLVLVLAVLAPLVLANYNKMLKAETKASAVASEALNSIRMVMACGSEKRMVEKFTPHQAEAKKFSDRVAPLFGLQFGCIFFGLYAVFGLAFWYGLKCYHERLIGGVSEVVVCLMSIMMLVISMQQISTPLISIGKASVAAAEFFTVIDAPKPESGSLKEPEVTATRDLVFKDVTFAYPSRPHVKILDNLNLTIEAGKLTAIVGPSGSGKSTIVGLVERWYNLQKQHVIAKAVEKKAGQTKKKKKGGEDKEDCDDEVAVSLDLEESGPEVELKGAVETCGRSLDEIDLRWWRSQIGLVQQEPFLFNDTIFKNVSFGLVGSPWEKEPEEKKRELVKEACKEAFADEFIDRLPDGYDTLCGDSGTKLSGGQRQRIAIARSIVRKPKILILDEATSSIDVRGERIVQAALDKVSQSRTTITIAHRLSTIKKADRIIVLKKGRVVEEGNHESLLDIEGGVYHGLVYAQKLSLGDDARDADEEGVKVGEDESGLGAVLSREKSLAASASGAAADAGSAPAEKNRSFRKSFVSLLLEQKSQWHRYLLVVLFSACAATNIPLMAYLFAHVINVFTLGPDDSELMSQASFWACMFVALAGGLGISYFAMCYVSTLVAGFVSSTYKTQYLEAILFQKPSYFDAEENTHGTLTARVAGDPKQLEELLGVPLGFLFQAIFGVLGGVAIAFAFSWKLALLGFFVTMPINLTASYFRVRYELEFEKLNNAVFEESSKFAAEAIGASRTVASLTLEDTINERYRLLLHSHVVAAFRKAQWRSPVFAISDSITIGCQALILWYGGRMLINGELDVIQFLVCFMAVMQGAEQGGQGLSFGPNAAQVTAASNRIMNARDSRNKDESTASEIPDAEGGLKIELRDVAFKYPTRDVVVFKNMNITIEKGQFAALVGASGCGKTSIISLLERFYEPAKGRILCNDMDISEINVYAWRKYLSLVAQEPTLLQGTIRENILLGVDPATISDERLHRVCRDASIHDFIVSLPEGYNTNIGSRGVSLSGGQKQRLSIARALIRDPSLLLLDEATSSLDSESEKLVQAAFERASKGRTMVVVAHRLATVQNADVIFVLGEGKVLEKGSHHELLKKKGVYWNMCHNQALDR